MTPWTFYGFRPRKAGHREHGQKQPKHGRRGLCPGTVRLAGPYRLFRSMFWQFCVRLMQIHRYIWIDPCVQSVRSWSSCKGTHPNVPSSWAGNFFFGFANRLTKNFSGYLLVPFKDIWRFQVQRDFMMMGCEIAGSLCSMFLAGEAKCEARRICKAGVRMLDEVPPFCRFACLPRIKTLRKEQTLLTCKPNWSIDLIARKLFEFQLL